MKAATQLAFALRDAETVTHLGPTGHLIILQPMWPQLTEATGDDPALQREPNTRMCWEVLH